MKELYIIKVGTTFANTQVQYGDFNLWINKTMGPLKVPVKTVDVENGDKLPSIKRCAGVIVTGSHAMVTENLEWSIRVEKWIPSILAAKIPFFGICYGHQLLARAAGGAVGDHPKGMEIGTVAITLKKKCKNDPIFAALPKTIMVHSAHSQTALKRPPGALHLAGNEFEPYHSFRVGACAWGVQFHPEYHPGIMRSYIDNLKSQLPPVNTGKAESDIDVIDTPHAAKILQRFGRLVEDH